MKIDNMEERCKNCKLWNKHRQIFHDDLYGVCDKIKEGDQSQEQTATAYVLDCMDGNTHTFHPRFDFGCVLFEQRNTMRIILEMHSEICCDQCKEVANIRINCPVCKKNGNTWSDINDDGELICDDCDTMFKHVSGDIYLDAEWEYEN